MRLLVPATVGLLLGAFPVPLPARAQARPDIIVLLDRYDSGEFDAVVETFAAIDDVEDARKDLEKHGRAWTEVEGPDAAPRRRLVVATFALEFARARTDARFDTWRDLRPALDWACDLIRQGPPSAEERLWHLAAIALAEGGRYWEALVDTSYSFVDRSNMTPRSIQVRARSIHEHVLHAQERYPDDPRLQFEDEHVDALRYGASWRREPARPAGVLGTHRREEQAELIGRLQVLAADPEVGGEAELWAGLILLLELDRPADAMAHLQAAGRARDPFVASLAYYSAGRAFESAGDLDAAERHYRRALDALPRVQSVSLSLAALLLSSGRPDEAYEIMRRSFDGPPVNDPFKTYGLGDYRHFDSYVARLRQEIRR